jgi:hypothetical protein
MKNESSSVSSSICFGSGRPPEWPDFVGGDGKLDLAVANLCGSDPSCSSGGTVSILLMQTR